MEQSDCNLDTLVYCLTFGALTVGQTHVLCYTKALQTRASFR